MKIFFQKDPHGVRRQGNMVTDRQLGFIYGNFDLDILDWKSKCRKSLHNHSINLVYNVPISVLYLYSSVMFVCAKQCSLPPAHAPPSVGGLVATWRCSGCRLHSPDTVKRLQLSRPGLGCGLGAHAIGGRGRRPCGAVVTSVGRAQAEGPPHHHPPLTLAPAASLSLSDQPRVQALDRVPVTSLHCSL